jgi:hypothetical protein
LWLKCLTAKTTIRVLDSQRCRVCRNNEQDTHEVEQDDVVIDEITIAELFAPPANCCRMGAAGAFARTRHGKPW